MKTLLHDLLIESARRNPEKTAVISGNDSLSYGELDDLTNRLAAKVRSLGVSPGDRVGFYLPKSVASIITLFGILKAGAVYVPLDPDSPPARVGFIIENCGIKCLVTSRAKRPAVESMFDTGSGLTTVLIMDEANGDWHLPARVVGRREIDESQPLDRPHTGSRDDLAYILYTSGSTGAPKGVMISHRASLTFVEWAGRTLDITSDDRLSNHAPLHFDLSILDIFCAVHAGATLIIVPPSLSVFPYRLAEWIDTQRITVWYSVPSILSMLVRQGELSRLDFASLRTIVFAGEVFPTKYLRELMSAVPHPAYFNFYGPTETNVITYHRVPVLAAGDDSPIPIGVACEGYDLRVIDESGAQVADANEPGELIASGEFLADGYWGDKEKTDASFVRDQSWSDTGAVFYKTGDLVTTNDRGEYIFVGRRDHMIKSRGYRIELGEIEAALYSHPSVDEAAVIGVPDELIGNRIVAFVVVRGADAPDDAGLRDHCQERIPRYMVPEAIEFRPRLPKTSTGKIDKTQLADVASSGAAKPESGKEA